MYTSEMKVELNVSSEIRYFNKSPNEGTDAQTVNMCRLVPVLSPKGNCSDDARRLHSLPVFRPMPLNELFGINLLLHQYRVQSKIHDPDGEEYDEPEDEPTPLSKELQPTNPIHDILPSVTRGLS